MGKPLRILVINDSEPDALQIIAQLRNGGYEPAFARVETAAGLLAALPRDEWDLVVTDHTLPHFGALEVLNLLRGREQDLPVIVISGSLGEEELVAVMRAGAEDCLAKGNLGRLCLAVDRSLRDAEVRQARRESDRRRGEAEERYRTLVEEIPALTYVAWADERGSTMYVSPQLKAMIGVSPAEWLAEPESWSKHLHPDDRARVLDEYQKAWVANKPFVSEYRVLDREGRVVWWRDEGRLIPANDGRPQFVRGFIVDITERKRAEETIRHLTYHDQLTGLPNSALLQERLRTAILSGRRERQPVALVLMNVDRFREINHTLGHQNGDRVLLELAQRLGDVVGQPDRVARLRGDEFALLLPGADVNLARQVAGKITKAMEEPFMVERLPIEIEASIGISVQPDHGEEAEILMQRADMAMQAAKRRNAGCMVYSPDCDPYDPRRLALLGELRRAIEVDQLLLHYQPKVDLKTRTVVGAEALVRWRHPKHGMVPPDQFIPLAEQGGLIKPLTRWVLDHALTQCEAWMREEPKLPVAVNLSARNLHDPQLVEQVTGLLASRQVAPELLQLELTESAVMTDPVRAGEILGVLDATGVGISIDDFGTGYTSLAYLRRLPVSELKIDKSFVMGMTKEDEDTAIVRSTNDLGHNLGLSVVAEGVEDEPTLELLGSFGCDAAQGYYMGRPMPAADLARWLRESPWGVQPRGGNGRG
jgi:diguanylate cyclase (GGDEF)-like protein/PAS domain S-box-containing protein